MRIFVGCFLILFLFRVLAFPVFLSLLSLRQFLLAHPLGFLSGTLLLRPLFSRTLLGGSLLGGTLLCDSSFGSLAFRLRLLCCNQRCNTAFQIVDLILLLGQMIPQRRPICPELYHNGILLAILRFQ